MLAAGACKPRERLPLVQLTVLPQAVCFGCIVAKRRENGTTSRTHQYTRNFQVRESTTVRLQARSCVCSGITRARTFSDRQAVIHNLLDSFRPLHPASNGIQGRVVAEPVACPQVSGSKVGNKHAGLSRRPVLAAALCEHISMSLIG